MANRAFIQDFRLRVAIITSIHQDFDPRIWKHATSLAAAGCFVKLVCPWKVPHRTVQDGVQIHTFPPVRHRLVRPFIVPVRVMGRLFQILRHVDVVHFHDIDLLPWMSLICIFRPVVYDVHENYAEEMLVRAWIPQIFRRPLYSLVRLLHMVFPFFIRNVVLAVPQQKAEFKPKYLNRVVIRNYASEQLVYQVRDNYFERPEHVLFTGGHYLENGSWMLLDIAEKLKKQGLSIPITVTDRFAGAAFRSRFEQEIENRQLHNFKITPCVPSYRIMDILNTGTIVLLPSLNVQKILMSIPTRLFEYMAAGLPVISSRLGIQGHIIEESNCGLLVEPGDVNAFAEAIAHLISNRSLAYSLGQNGQKAFRENYTWESQMPGLLEFYKIALNI